MSISRCLSSSETLTPSTLAALALMMPTAISIAVSRLFRTPVIRQRRIEHVAEPVDDHGLAHLRQHAVIDPGVVVGVAAELCQRPRRHQDDASAGLFDRRDLLLIGADDVVDGLRILHREVIGAGAGKHQRAAPRLRRPDRALDQFQRGRPVQPHAALRGVHGFGDAEAEVPDMLAEGNGAVPVDRRRQPRIDVGERVGHHMRRGERHAVERALELGRESLATPPGDRSRSSRRRRGSFSDSDETGITGLFMIALLTP